MSISQRRVASGGGPSRLVASPQSDAALHVGVCVVSAALLAIPSARNRPNRPQRLENCLLTSSSEAQPLISVNDAAVNHGAENAAENNATRAPPQLIASGRCILTIIEALALVVSSGLGIALVTQVWRSTPPHIPVFSGLNSVLASAYALGLVFTRAYVGDASATLFSSLRYHVMAIYLAEWISTLFTTWSALRGAEDVVYLWALLARASIFLLLLFIHLCASRRSVQTTNRIDDVSVGLAPEESASLASRLSLGWKAKFLWTGHRTKLESRHLSGLSHNQKSTNVLASFRQATPTGLPLLKKLLAFFKRALVVQAVWAAVTSICS